MTSTLTVATVQWGPGPDPETNARAIESFVERSAAGGAHVVVFPEYSHAFIPGDGPEMAKRAQTLEGGFGHSLREIASRHRVVVVAGALVADGPADGQAVHNAVVVARAEGVEVFAEKIHLYDAFGMAESQWVNPGRIDEPRLLDIGGHRMGFLSCYDLRFPEVTRRLADAGATCLVVPAQWVPGPHKIEHWRTLLAARAIETQCFVVAADHPAPHGVGHSQVVSPLGEALVERVAGEGIDSLELDIDQVERARGANPMARARRFQVSPRE